LARIFKGRKVVYNVVGPFMQLGKPVVQACLRAGCHYLDTTGETDWMLFLKRRYGSRFAAKDLLLCPASSFMWTAGQLAAELALETPGVDTLELVYIADSAVSVASSMSFLRMCTRDQYYLANRRFETWPQATAFQVTVPGEHRVYNALPWSGGGEPIWYEGDPRVRNCSVLVAFKNQEMMAYILNMLRDFEDKYKNLSDEKHEALTNEWGQKLTAEEPEREDPDLNRSQISCFGRGNTASVTVITRGNSPYIQTGVLAAETIQRILHGRLRATGFASAAAAFGARELLGAQSEEGHLAWETTPM
jgi:hypothetical protein